MLLLLTGERHAGKTTAAALLACRPCRQGRPVQGILAPALYAGGRPRGFDLVDLASTGVPLLEQVLTTGRELLCRDRAAKERLIIRMLNDVEDFLPLRRRALEERRRRWLGTS